MSASEKLKALKETGFTCEHWTDFNASDLDVTDELIALVEVVEQLQLREFESGVWYDVYESLEATLAALDEALGDVT